MICTLGYLNFEKYCNLSFCPSPFPFKNKNNNFVFLDSVTLISFYDFRYGNNKVDPIIITEPHFSYPQNSPMSSPCTIDPVLSLEPVTTFNKFVEPITAQDHRHNMYVGRSLSHNPGTVVGDFSDEMMAWYRKFGLKRRKSYV